MYIGQFLILIVLGAYLLLNFSLLSVGFAARVYTWNIVFSPIM